MQPVKERLWRRKECDVETLRALEAGGPQERNAGVCSVEGCGKPRHGRGLCKNHYGQVTQRAARLVEKERDPRFCAYCGEKVPPEFRKRDQVAFCSGRHKQLAYTQDGRNASVARKSYYKRKYGMTVEQVEEMVASGSCAICGTQEWKGRHGRPHIDHDHKTGRVRGLLCHNCNVLLGLDARDNPDILRAAIAYLAS